MVEAFNKAAESKPDEALPYLVIGDYVMLQQKNQKD
jgi:hypothetical protein